VKVDAGPVYVSDNQIDNFTITPATPVFVNGTKTLLYADTLGFTVQNDGTAYRTKLVWKITPANGVNPNPDLGNDNNSNDPEQWTTGSTSPAVTFTKPGNYTATLKIGSNSCGVGTSSQTFCVDNLPDASYTVTSNVACAGTTLQFNSSSPPSICSITHHSWWVTYSNGGTCGNAAFTFVNNTDTNSKSPQILFTNPGEYTVHLKTYNGDPATSSTTSQIIIISAPPTIKINADSLCFNESLKPKFTITNCNAAPIQSYQWSFPGGTPSSSTSATPPEVNYSVAGTYKVELVVTTKCGIVADSTNIVVNPLPVLQQQASKTYCNGANTEAITFTGAAANTIFKWTNDNPSIGLPASGIGDILSFIITNTDNTKSKVANIQVTPYLGNCSGEPIQFTLTVLPYLSPPIVTSPITYNLNERADSLKAHITSGNTINWYSDAGLQNRLPSAPVPSTKVVQAVNYYVTQSNVLGCESNPSVITVEVIPTLSIPNAFTPNGDGINDFWNIKGSDFGPMIWLQVFNRYGSLLYNEKNHSVKWDGTYNSKRVPTGVYYYILKYDNKTFSGNVTVIY
jgi:gliding motility-associated-like protein